MAMALGSAAQPAGDVVLPPPHTSGGMPLREALQKRHSTREFASREIPPQTLSDLLWAAAGINRENGGRTAPTANGRQEIELWVALPQGIYLYQPRENRLKLQAAGDFRAKTGTQDYVGKASLNLVYVSDLAKMTGASREDKERYAAADVGFVAQNVYLFCASEGLATVVRASIDRKALPEELKVGPDRLALLAQSVGYAEK
jgi:nitroreductase